MGSPGSICSTNQRRVWAKDAGNALAGGGAEGAVSTVADSMVVVFGTADAAEKRQGECAKDSVEGHVDVRPARRGNAFRRGPLFSVGMGTAASTAVQKRARTGAVKSNWTPTCRCRALDTRAATFMTRSEWPPSSKK